MHALRVALLRSCAEWGNEEVLGSALGPAIADSASL